MIPAFSTNSYLASLLPTLWVMFLGMMFELAADLKRYSNDKKVNHKPATRINVVNGELKEEAIFSQDIKVGDILKLTQDIEIPADCLVLQTQANDNGQCYVHT